MRAASARSARQDPPLIDIWHQFRHFSRQNGGYGMNGSDLRVRVLVPQEWFTNPPRTLVIGSGPFARALTGIFAAGSLDFNVLTADPASDEDGGYPRVLERLERVCLVADERISGSEALQLHGATWEWVKKLTSAGDQHELTFVFIAGGDSKTFEEALALGLGVAAIDPATTGHGIWRMGDSLEGLLSLFGRIRPMDLLPLRARRAADVRHVALARLRTAIAQDDPSIASEAARDVLSTFSGQEYHLDLFCRHPSHRHGNLLRTWLNSAVTGSVTPDWLSTGREQFPVWLTETN